MKKVRFVWFCVFVFLISCQKSRNQQLIVKRGVKDSIVKKETNDKGNTLRAKKTLDLDVFSQLPVEVEGGGGCFFSLSKEDLDAQKYVCVNNLANLAYISINGKMIEFKLKKHDESGKFYFYTNKERSLKIQIEKNITIDDETTRMEGVITYTSDSGEIAKRFIGVCGF